MGDFSHDANGVAALVKNAETGAKMLIRARYMVACDGNRSTTRSKLGINIEGHGLLSHSITIYFHADLGRFVKGKYNGVIYVNNPEVRGFFRLGKPLFTSCDMGEKLTSNPRQERHRRISRCQYRWQTRHRRKSVSSKWHHQREGGKVARSCNRCGCRV